MLSWRGLLENAPAGLTFPLDLRGKTAVISIEPYPDNSACSFYFKTFGWHGRAGYGTYIAYHER